MSIGYDSGKHPSGEAGAVKRKKGLTLDVIVIERFGCIIKLLEVSLDRIGAESTPAVELFRHIL